MVPRLKGTFKKDMGLSPRIDIDAKREHRTLRHLRRAFSKKNEDSKTYKTCHWIKKDRRTYPALKVHYSRLKQTTFGSVISSSANLMPSRPRPEFLTPPKGMASIR